MVWFGGRSDVIAAAIQASIQIRLTILARFRPKSQFAGESAPRPVCSSKLLVPVPGLIPGSLMVLPGLTDNPSDQ
jgi:hypothetical protein